MNTAPPNPAGKARWWLDPALARMAFSTDATGENSGSGPELAPHLPGMGLDAFDDDTLREVGGYELHEVIGQGGMGVVYRARQRELDREVALKLLSPRCAGDAEFGARLRREARHAARLQHPNIVAVHDLDEHEGLLCYAMQLVRGRSLSQWLDADGPLPPQLAASLLRTLADAMHYAHRLGVLHLDLKPGNILIDERGSPLITDFGLARGLEQARRDESIAGTPGYMAPEQLDDSCGALSPATDVWALGAVLYETLTGHPPFEAHTADDTLQLLRRGRVRTPSRYLRLPPDLEAICMHCLAKRPEARYPDTNALADDLGRFLDGRAVSVRRRNFLQQLTLWSHREPRTAAAAGLAMLALTVGLIASITQWQRAEANAQTANRLLQAGRRDAALRLESDGHGWRAAALLLQNLQAQPDGDDEQTDRLRLGLLFGQGSQLIDQRLIADARPLAVALSADGNRLALALSDRSVRWYDSTGLRERGRIDLRTRRSADGEPRAFTRLRFIDNDTLLVTMEWYRHLANPAAGNSWLLDLRAGAVLEPPAAFTGLAETAFADDGGSALLRGRDGRVQAWQTRPWAPLAPALPLPRGETSALSWRITPDRRHALALDAAMHRLDLRRWPDLQLQRSLQLPGEAGLSAWAVAPDGGQLALGDIEGRIFLYTLARGRLQPLPSTRGLAVGWLDFSEDGAWLAAGGADGRVHVFDTGSGESLASAEMLHDFPVQQLTIDHAHRLLLVSGEGQAALWRIPATGDAQALPPIRVGLAPGSDSATAPYASDWSRDSGLLASAGLDGQLRLWQLPASSTLPALPAPQLPEQPGFDGRHVVDVAENLVRSMTLDGRPASTWKRLPQPPGFAEVTHDGRSLLLTTGPQLRILGLPGLHPRHPPIALPASPQRLLLDPQGQHLLLAFAEPGGDGFNERLVLYALASGRQLPATVVLPGPLRTLGFSDDGQRLHAVGPDHGATVVLAAGPDGLRPLARYPHAAGLPVVAADFTSDGRSLLLLRADDPRQAQDTLVIARAGRIETRIALPDARPYGVIALANGAFLPGEHFHLRVDGHALRRIPRAASSFDASMGAYAVSHDRRLLAVASLRSVQLYTAAGDALGMPLWLDTPTSDGIVSLAFSPDDRQLLARTLWTTAHWRFAPPPWPDAELSTLLASLGTARDADVQPPTASRWRTALRQRAPDRWPVLSPRPQPSRSRLASRDRNPPPTHAGDAPDILLDLAPYHATDAFNPRSSLRPYPAGVQRVHGVDFDLRGSAEVGARGLEPCLAIPGAARVAAIDVLLPAPPTSRPTPRTGAELRFHYVDGSQASVPIRTGNDPARPAGGTAPIPQAFPISNLRAAQGFAITTLAAPRLLNPQPARKLRCIDLRSHGEPLRILALTAEAAPVTGATHAAAAAAGTTP